MNIYAHLLGILGTAGGSVFLTHLFTRNKTNAEVSHIVGKTYIDALENLRKEVFRLEKRVHELENELNYWKGSK